MVGFFFGIGAGFLAGYLYGSERGREEARRRLTAAPEPLRRAGQSVASAAGGGAQRLAGAVATAPVPDSVKQAATRASSKVQTAAQQAGQALTPASEIAQPNAADLATRPTE